MKRGSWFLVGGLILGGTLQAASRWDVAGERLQASDVELTQVASTWSWERPASALRGELSAAYNDLRIDYLPVPFDFRGEARTVREQNESVQANLWWRASEAWEWFGVAGGYEGSTNYRSLWLAEYFRQQYEPLGTTAGASWVTPDPQGWNVGVGTRWEVLPGSGFLEANVTVGRDRVAPGYEIDFDGLNRGREKLNTVSVLLTGENVLSPRLRSRISLRASRVSEREWRWGGEVALNWAVGERGVLRGVLGGATEQPQFDAWYAGLAAEWAVSDHWTLFAQGRTYSDSGEIEDALLFTSAAPGLDSQQWSAGFRWSGDRWVWRVQAGELRSDQDPTNPRLDFFQNLYRDRNWTLLQVAGSLNF